jgi:hypothetical protein
VSLRNGEQSELINCTDVFVYDPRSCFLLLMLMYFALVDVV